MKDPISRRKFMALTAAFSLALAFGKLTGFAQAATKAVKWPSTMEMAVHFELVQASGGRYQRPYVAAYIEDASGKAVRTLSLWAQTGGKGRRHMPELRRWYRNEQDRQARDGGDLMSTVTSPTRNAGKYTVVWDGKNDKKALVDQGDYYICVEESREDGPYQLVRQKITVGSTPFTHKLGDNGELKGVGVEYRKRI